MTAETRFNVASVTRIFTASTLATLARHASSRAMFAPPGEIFSCSNLGYQLAGRMIEVAGGRPYAAQVRQVLLDPLGLRATSFSSVPPAGDVAIGTVDPTARPAGVAGAETWPFAGVYSNVSDLARFAIAFMNGGRIDGRQVLSPEVIARVSAPAARFHSGEGDYGYGVRVYRHRGVGVVEHGGVSPDGYRSLLYMVPSRRIAVIVLANRAGRRPYAVADAALDALLPGVLEPIAPMPGPVPMDSTEMARYVGRYASGVVVNVTVDDGVLTLHQGAAALPIRRLADGRFVAGSEETGGGWVAFVPGRDGSVQYLHYNMRAFRRL